jgi:hypothetical protein
MLPSADSLRASDASVVARFLEVRSLLHDRHLARLERLILDRYNVQPTRRLPSSLVALVRGGFVRPGEGELWPVVFMTTVDVSVALCINLTSARVADLGTAINGPQRIRHRGWEDWWGWEIPLSALSAGYFDLPAPAQEDALARWSADRLDWLAGNGLLQRKS